jgi:hypothetical protein
VRAVLVEATSQPLAGSPSQSPKPAAQAPTAQRPRAQDRRRVGRGAGRRRRRRSEARRFAGVVSQPLAALPSQSPKPGPQAVARRRPGAQRPRPGEGHTVRTRRSARRCCAVSTSQPLAGSPSQSAKPALQRDAQRPRRRWRVALGPLHAAAAGAAVRGAGARGRPRSRWPRRRRSRRSPGAQRRRAARPAAQAAVALGRGRRPPAGAAVRDAHAWCRPRSRWPRRRRSRRSPRRRPRRRPRPRRSFDPLSRGAQTLPHIPQWAPVTRQVGLAAVGRVAVAVAPPRFARELAGAVGTRRGGVGGGRAGVAAGAAVRGAATELDLAAVGGHPVAVALRRGLGAAQPAAAGLAGGGRAGAGGACPIAAAAVGRVGLEIRAAGAAGGGALGAGGLAGVGAGAGSGVGHGEAEGALAGAAGGARAAMIGLREVGLAPVGGGAVAVGEARRAGGHAGPGAADSRGAVGPGAGVGAAAAVLRRGAGVDLAAVAHVAVAVGEVRRTDELTAPLDAGVEGVDDLAVVVAAAARLTDAVAGAEGRGRTVAGVEAGPRGVSRGADLHAPEAAGADAVVGTVPVRRAGGAAEGSDAHLRAVAVGVVAALPGGHVVARTA